MKIRKGISRHVHARPSRMLSSTAPAGCLSGTKRSRIVNSTHSESRNVDASRKNTVASATRSVSRSSADAQCTAEEHEQRARYGCDRNDRTHGQRIAGQLEDKPRQGHKGDVIAEQRYRPGKPVAPELSDGKRGEQGCHGTPVKRYPERLMRASADAQSNHQCPTEVECSAA